MSVQRITVALGERSYDVVLGAGARHELADLIATRAPRAKRCVIVTSPSLRDQPWADLVSGIEQIVLEVPDGEDAKTPETLVTLVEGMAELALSRHDVVVGLGGGAITDLAGFAAAVYLRGVAFIQVPTSLVGQVDAAIGGKTAVNLRAGKNLMGSFYQPVGVLADAACLSTLPPRELHSGLGEVVKCWLLEGRGVAGLADTPLDELVYLSVALKARIVSADEREGGERAFLNYGHTLAHALEKISLARSTDELRHGEAVAIGLAFAIRLARHLGRVSDGAVSEVDAVLDILNLPRTMPEGFGDDELIDAMAHDKKAHHDLTFVLPGPNGFAVVTGVSEDDVRQVLQLFRGEA